MGDGFAVETEQTVTLHIGGQRGGSAGVSPEQASRSVVMAGGGHARRMACLEELQTMARAMASAVDALQMTIALQLEAEQRPDNDDEMPLSVFFALPVEGEPGEPPHEMTDDEGRDADETERSLASYFRGAR